MFSDEFGKLFKNTFFVEHLQATSFNVTNQDYLKGDDVFIQLLSYLHVIGENFMLKGWGIWYYSPCIGGKASEIWYFWNHSPYKEEIFWRQEIAYAKELTSYSRSSAIETIDVWRLSDRTLIQSEKLEG